MADQASMTVNGPSSVTGRMGTVRPASGTAAGGGTAGPGDMVSNVAEAGEDLLTLAELQARLAAIELKQNIQAVRLSGAVLLAGAMLALAGLPVLLAGVAELLVSYLEMGRGWALIAVAAAALVLAATCVAIAAARLRGADIGFPITREEFARNLNWVRTVLLYSGRSARGRRR